MLEALKLLLALVLVGFATAFAQVPSLHPASICELREHPSRYLGKTVVVTGQLDLGTMPHGGLLLNSSECGAGAALVESAAMQKRQIRGS
jgi:hypothetical protein